MNRIGFVLLLAALLTCRASAQNLPMRPLEYAPAAVDNPLKGLVPYAGDWRDRFPHSMEFSYLPLSALVIGHAKYDWTPMENLLDGIAARGHQAVFRIYLEYPGKSEGIPAFLVKEGLKVFPYQNTNTQPFPRTESLTPDYQDLSLRKTLIAFIAALGRKYDGDPRIGFITAGLLGTWGEWHDYPRNELFADKAVQREVLDAYEAAFKTTRILVRYPAGEHHAVQTANTARGLGYHDDSFAWSTLETGKKEDSWFFLSLLRAAGPEAASKWKTQPIGGEIRPEAWGKVFDERPDDARIQDFRRCVAETHVTWLMDSGMFAKKQDAGRIRRAEEAVRRMGYEFYVSEASVSKPRNGRITLTLKLENRGTAPFYYDWPAEIGLIDTLGHIGKVFSGNGKLTGLLPGEAPRTWTESLEVAKLPAGRYKIAVRVPNPLKNANPIRFANKTQNADLPGWLTVGEFRR